MLLGAGRLPETLVEGMACEGGCVAGPGSCEDPKVTVRMRQKLLAQADARGVTENLEQQGFAGVDMERR